jgi:hypothetical protein
MRRQIVILFVLVLFGAALNVPLALLAVAPPNAPLPSRINIIGPAAAPLGWPAPTPHATPWPAPRQWSEDGVFGHVRRTAWASDPSGNNTTHQQQADLYGWPLPVLRHVQLWWPQADLAWALTPTVPDTGLRLRPAGLVVNPLLFAGVVWLVFFAPVLLWCAIVRRRRASRGRCPACGYPAGVSTGCTECGAPIPDAVRLGSSAGAPAA